jgi:hypothetical protein
VQYIKYVLSRPLELSCETFSPFDQCLASYTLKMRAETHKHCAQNIQVSYGHGLHLIVGTIFCTYLLTEKTRIMNLKPSLQYYEALNPGSHIKKNNSNFLKRKCQTRTNLMISQNCKKRLLVSSPLSACLSVLSSVCLSVRMEKLGSHWPNFH